MSGAVPELRFPGFECSWEVRTLGEFMSFKNGVNADKSQYGTGRKFINVLDIIEAGPITHDRIIGSVDIPVAEFEKNEVKYGDILFQRSSETREEVGQSNVYLDPERTASFGGFVIRGRLHELVNPRFLDNLLKTSSVRKDITSRSGGSTRFNIGQESLGSVEVCMPLDEAERSKIADFFDQVSSKISLLKNQVDELRQFKTGLMQRLFSQELRFTREDGSDFPDWDERELQEIGERSKVKNSGIKITRVLTNSATMGVIDQGDYFDKDIANAENIGGYYVIRKGEFIYNPRISVSAPVGPINRNDLADGVMSPLYTVFRINLPDTDFFAHYFASTMWHDYMKSVANYGARHDRMAISIGDFLALPLPVPHADERAKIAGALSALDAKIDAMMGQITHMEAFKKGLLQKMFV